jgi:amino acid transporter
MPSPGSIPQQHETAAADGTLVRGLGTLQATALNVANMVGIGPFITIPLLIKAMGGPQALIAWVIAALLVLCDGLVWSELGAALPGSGGTYHFLREIFGRYRWGRLLPFLFIWQFLVSGTLEMASGYIAAIDYLKYMLPQLESPPAAWGGQLLAPTLAAACPLVVAAVLCRNIRSLGWLGVVLCAGTIVTTLSIIVAGLAHFQPSLLTLPADAFEVDRAWIQGLGAAMLIAIYDYLGYYNICHLGDEARDPGRTIPRAVMLSVAIVAAIYLTMNISIIAVVPWQEAQASENIAALFMERLFGRTAAVAFTGLILWTVAACMFAITLGYSRIPYAAARGGDFFRVFAWLHPTQRYPAVSLWTMALLTALFCYLPLAEVITAAVTVRIVVQFLGQIAALHVLRTSRPDVPLPFRMWLYPLPSLVATVGWTFVLVSQGWTYLLAGAAVVLSGMAAYALWRQFQPTV